MLDFFNSAIFIIGNRAINTAQLVWMIMFLVSWVIVFRLFSTNGIKELYKKYEVGEKQQKKLNEKFIEIGGDIKIGAKVKMKQNRQVGIVKEIKGKKAILQVGVMPITVDLQDLVVVKDKVVE